MTRPYKKIGLIFPSLGFGVRNLARIWVMVGFCIQDTLSSLAVLACPAFRPSVCATSKDILRTRLDLVWRASLFACKITLLARALGLKAEQPLGQARLRRYGVLFTSLGHIYDFG